jgi:hypothetical protein
VLFFVGKIISSPNLGEVRRGIIPLLLGQPLSVIPGLDPGIYGIDNSLLFGVAIGNARRSIVPLSHYMD